MIYYQLISGAVFFLGMIFVIIYEIRFFKKIGWKIDKKDRLYRHFLYAMFCCVEIGYLFFIRFYDALQEILK